MQQCTKGHTMLFTTETGGAYLSGSYGCDVCRVMKSIASGRYWCPVCKYDVCPACRAPPPYFSGKCIGGHKLVWSKDKPATGENYQCVGCRVTKKCIEGRWTCAICLYDACPACHPAPPPSAAVPPPPTVVAASH